MDIHWVKSAFELPSDLDLTWYPDPSHKILELGILAILLRVVISNNLGIAYLCFKNMHVICDFF